MRIDVLDHGYVEFIEAYGHGEAGWGLGNARGLESDWEVGLIEAARQSTQGSFRGWEQDANLLYRLWLGRSPRTSGERPPPYPKHATPFEFAGMIIEVQAPIFVFREWHRHRTQSYNEMSARYAPLPDLCYVPNPEKMFDRMRVDERNKQAAGVAQPNLSKAAEWHSRVQETYESLELLYQYGLAAGVPKELARITMPVGHYSRMRANANLRNWLSFLTLRCDPAAQWEIRQYANAVAMVINQVFPYTNQIWERGNKESFSSGDER
jgi:thymidylate synthase (FAD)